MSDSLKLFKKKVKKLLPPDQQGVVDQMDMDELTTLQEMLGEFTTTGESKTYDELNTLDWKYQPVSPEQFLTDDYYIGKMGNNLYPILKQHYLEIFSRDDIVEVILTGSIGYGKSFMSTILLARVLYEVSCLKSPQKYLGIAEGTPIVLSILNVTGAKSSEYFDNIRELVDMSPYFQEMFPRNKRKDSALEFPNRVSFINAGSTELGAIGSNVFATAMDEMNFMQKSKTSVRKKAGEEEYDRAMKLYSNIMRRLKSRFMYAGKSLGKVFLISSRAEPDTFLEKHIKEVQNGTNAYIVDHKTWDVHPASKFGSNWFYLDLGDANTMPRILPPEDLKQSAVIWEEEQAKIKSPYEETILKIPGTYLNDFKTDMFNSLRDIAGKATDSMNVFIVDKNAIRKAFGVISDNDTSTQHIKSYEKVRTTLPINKQTTNFVDGFYLDIDKLKKPHLARYIHIDLALKGGIGGDSAGFASAYQDGWKIIERNGTSESLPIIKFDFTLEIHANPEMKEIMFADIRSLIYKMQEKVPIQLVSSDGFQSSDLRQTLNRKGITAELFSLDVKPDGYETYKSLILNECINIPYHKKPYDETLKLEKNLKTRKIDHPISSCFTGDTKISLLDGRDLSFIDLIKEVGSGKELWTYSLDLTTNKVVPGRIMNPRATKNVRKLCYVTLDNGDIIKCTPDHRFLLKSGMYKEASLLAVGESLMPLYKNISEKGLLGYEMYINPISGKKHYTHITVAGSALRGYVRHHIDYNKLNNNPNNLEIITKSKHCNIHNRNQTNSERSKRSESIKLWHKNNKHKQVYKDRSAKLRATIKNRLGITDWNKFVRELNHKVVKVKIKDIEEIPVYDIEVPIYSNFLLSSGVFVHNSKDITDAIAGAAHQCSINATSTVNVITAAITAATVKSVTDIERASRAIPTIVTPDDNYNDVFQKNIFLG